MDLCHISLLPFSHPGRRRNLDSARTSASALLPRSESTKLDRSRTPVVFDCLRGAEHCLCCHSVLGAFHDPGGWRSPQNEERPVAVS